MLNDPLANALSLIKNAETKGKGLCHIQPSSKLIGGVLNLLKEKGYISEFEFKEDGKAGYLVKREDLEKWESRYLPARDFGLLILTTTKGIISHTEAKEKGVGGKVLAYIY